MYGLFFFLCIFLKIRDPSLHLLSSDIEADNEGCGCGKDEQQSFKKISHRDLPLNYYIKHEKMSTQTKNKRGQALITLILKLWGQALPGSRPDGWIKL